MGIRSLSEYLYINCPSIGSWFTIDSCSDEILIIDANAVFYNLCSNNDDLKDSISKILHFQSCMAKCRCIWVFDGESIIEKLPTQISRSSNIERSTWIPLGIVSIMVSKFKNMGIEYLISPGEADGTIAHLAVKLDAFIVSNDSDFYIYESRGYIPLQNLSYSKEKISGKRIINQEVADILGISKNDLPYFALLVGNDTFAGIDPPCTKKTSRIKYWSCMIKSNHQVCNSIELKNAAKQYQIPKDIVYQYCLNEELSVAASQGRLDPTLLRLLHHKVFWCGNLLEDLKRESAWDASLKIRLGICSFVFPKDTIITQYCRKGLKFTPKTFQVISSSELNGYNLLFETFGLNYQDLQHIPIQFRPFMACLKSLINYLYYKDDPIMDFQLNSLILTTVISCRRSDIDWGTSSSSKTPSFVHLKAQMQILIFTFHLFQQCIWPIDNPFDVSQLFKSLDPSVLYHCLNMSRKGASVENLLRGMDDNMQMMRDFTLLKEFILLTSKDQISR